MKTSRTIFGCVAGLMALAMPSGAGVLQYTYDAAGRITAVDYGNSTNTTYAYDTNGNLLEETTAAATDANLTLSKSAPAGPVPAGDTLSYSLLVTNSGPNAASSVVVTDTLPFGINLQSALASQGSCTLDDQTVTCNLGVIAPGATATVTIHVLPAFEAVFTNTASVALAQTDAVPGNNTDDAVTSVTPATDTDGDGLPDWWEAIHFGGITNADKSVDSDSDGVYDGDEFAGDTDPHNVSNFLSVLEFTRSSDTFLEWQSSPIRTYTLQYTAQPGNSAVWTNLMSGIEGDGQIMTGKDTSVSAPYRTYRIKATAP